MKKKLNCVLLIDDDFPTNCFNEMVIEDAGIAEKIKYVQSAIDGLDYLAGRNGFASNDGTYPRPDLIFLDINMPAMNGWEFLDEYAKLPEEQRGKIVVVMLTASPNPDDEAKAKAKPDVYGFLNKPLTPDMIGEIMQKHFPDYL